TILAAVEVRGRPSFYESTGGAVAWRSVTPGYFQALKISIIKGRPFQQNDLQPNKNPIILNETLAQKLFPNSDPIGQQLRLFRVADAPWRTVVGVARDVKNDGLATEAGPEFYLPWKNDSVELFGDGYLVVRTQLNAKAVAAWMRSETSGLDSAL